MQHAPEHGGRDAGQLMPSHVGVHRGHGRRLHTDGRGLGRRPSECDADAGFTVLTRGISALWRRLAVASVRWCVALGYRARGGGHLRAECTQGANITAKLGT